MTNKEIHQLATSEYYIFEGTDFFNNRPVFQVLGRTNDYVGEWHKNIENAETEMMELNK